MWLEHQGKELSILKGDNLHKNGQFRGGYLFRKRAVAEL